MNYRTTLLPTLNFERLLTCWIKFSAWAHSMEIGLSHVFPPLAGRGEERDLPFGCIESLGLLSSDFYWEKSCFCCSIEILRWEREVLMKLAFYWLLSPKMCCSVVPGERHRNNCRCHRKSRSRRWWSDRISLKCALFSSLLPYQRIEVHNERVKLYLVERDCVRLSAMHHMPFDHANHHEPLNGRPAESWKII